jgi:hypothetical protein
LREPYSPDKDFDPLMGLEPVADSWILKCPRCETFYEYYVSEGDGMYIDYDEFVVRQMDRTTCRLLSLVMDAEPDLTEIRGLLDSGEVRVSVVSDALPARVREDVFMPALADAIRAGLQVDWTLRNHALGLSGAKLVKQATWELKKDGHDLYSVFVTLKKALESGVSIKPAVAEIERIYNRDGRGAAVLFHYFLEEGNVTSARVVLAESPWHVFYVLREGNYELGPFVPELLALAIESQGTRSTRLARQKSARELLERYAMASATASAHVLQVMEETEMPRRPDLEELVELCQMVVEDAP